MSEAYNRGWNDAYRQVINVVAESQGRSTRANQDSMMTVIKKILEREGV
jgi:hypothetical protein